MNNVSQQPAFSATSQSKLVLNLIAAKALVDTPEKWCKGRYHEGGYHGFDRRDILTAVKAATPNNSERLATFEALDAALPATVKKTGHYLAAYNDDPSTSHADIMTLFERAKTSDA